MSKSELQAIFEKIFEKVDDDGKFQKRFNVLFNFVFLILVGMPNVNLFIAMSIPQHWCHVPGREFTNFTQEEWKNLTIPRNDDSTEFSSCQMYKESNLSDVNYVIVKNQDKEIVDCQHDWEYDKTWYTSTIPSQENWVCDKELIVTNTFVFGRLGDIVGSLIFSQLGDVLGRTFTYYSTILLLIISRISLVFTSSHVELFIFFVFLGGTTASAVFQSALVIGMEITNETRHATLTMIQCVGWTIAFCTLPMLMWILKDWTSFFVITTLPCGIFLFLQKYLVESPRWLASKGKKERCMKELRKIARVNRKVITDDLSILVNEACSKREQAYGIISIFSHWRLVKNTLLIIYGTLLINIMYLVVTLGTSDMYGNPHMNYFWQGLAELPAYFVGQILCNRIGRRFTNVLGCIGMTTASFILIFTMGNASYFIYSQISVVFIKFCLSLAFYAVNLTAVEIYPTPVKQSGFAIGGVTANFFSMFGPYVLYLKVYHPSYPYIVSCTISFIGTALAFLLPETLNAKLPNTLADAYAFGKDQPYFRIPRKETHVAIKNDDN